MPFDTHYMHKKYLDICLSNQHKNNSFLMIILCTAYQRCHYYYKHFQLAVSVLNYVNVNVTNL